MMRARFQAAEDYIENIISSGLENFEKGEYISLIRAMVKG